MAENNKRQQVISCIYKFGCVTFRCFVLGDFKIGVCKIYFLLMDFLIDYFTEFFVNIEG